MNTFSKKRLAALGLGLLVLLVLWKWWRISEKVSTPPLSAPMVTEARPAPPLPTAKNPLLTPPPVHQVSKKLTVTKKPPREAPSKRFIPPMPATIQAPRVIIPPSLPPPLSEEEWHGNDTAITRSGEILIRNDHQWIQFWAEHHPHEAAPDVDFTKKIVVGVFSGPRPADAFTIEITALREQSGKLFVDYREHLPPPGTFAVDVTVYPYHIKVIPRTTLPVKFNKLALVDPNR